MIISFYIGNGTPPYYVYLNPSVPGSPFGPYNIPGYYQIDVPDGNYAITVVDSNDCNVTRYCPDGIYDIDCNESQTYNGGQSYPSLYNVNLGSYTGNVALEYVTYQIPDLMIVEFDSNIVINLGYRGASKYNFGGSSRTNFNNSLTGKINPIHGGTYPSTPVFGEIEADGYPSVNTLTTGSVSFMKNTSTQLAIVKVYAPMSGTAWNFKLKCPTYVPSGPTTTTTTTTLEIETVFIHIPNI
jgi:hypothetical protein